MFDAYLDWNGDYILTPNGSIQTAQGWDRARQRIIRAVLTNSYEQLPDGTFTPPDYIYAPGFGLGAASMIDQNPTQAYLDKFKQRINQAAFAEASVDPGTVPSVKFTQPQLNTVQVDINVSLKNGLQGQLQVDILK